MTSTIRIPTFDATIVFMRDVGAAALKRYISKRYALGLGDVEGLEDEFSGITFELDDMTWVIYVPDTKLGDFVWLVRTLSHEANHVILQLMRKVGVQDDETICYAQDNLLGELLGKCFKNGKKPD